MNAGSGRFLRLSPQRRWMVDVAVLSRRVPMAGVKRTIDVSRVMDARAALMPRPRWSAIMTKAFALVAARRPELRRSYMPLPWPHLYEHPHSVASLVVERELDGEPAVLISQIGRPEAMALPELDAEIGRLKTAPLAAVGAFRRALRVARYPLIVRRVLGAAVLYGTGRGRARYLGTFAVNALLVPETEILGTTSPIAVQLYYGGADAHRRMSVQVFFDHRVLDAAPVARALLYLEDVLSTTIAEELQAMRDVPRAVIAAA